MTIDSTRLFFGFGLNLENSHHGDDQPRKLWESFAEAARLVGDQTVLFHTVCVSVTKPVLPTSSVRSLVIKAIAEAFDQEAPSDAELAALTRQWRQSQRD